MQTQKEPLTLPNVIIFIVNFCHYTITHLFSAFILLQKIWGKWLREVQTIDKKSSVFKCALVLLCRYFSNRSRLASFLWSFSCDHKMICDYSCVTKMSLTHPRNNLQIWTKNKSEANTQRESMPSSTPISSADSWRKSAKKIIRRKNIIHVIIPSMNPRLNNYLEIKINFIALQILRIIL